MATVVNLYKEPYDIYIGRPGKGQPSEWGNPFRVKEHGHGKCIYTYEGWMRERLLKEPELKGKILALKGKRLGCFCKPKACHGDVLVKLIEELSMATTTANTVAVIGTAGRARVPNYAEWSYMLQETLNHISPTDTLVSGGAAWADHVAVQLFLDGLVNKLVLHLPAPFKDGKFVECGKSAGSVDNYYHSIMSKELGYDTLAQIQEAMQHENCHVTTQPARSGYAALFARNSLIAASATKVVALTYGKGDVPANGGTKDTWDKCKTKDKVHISIQASNDYTLELNNTKVDFKVLNKDFADLLAEGMSLEPYMLTDGTHKVKNFDSTPVYLEKLKSAVGTLLNGTDNITLHQFEGEDINLIPVPQVLVALGGTITLEVFSDTDEGFDTALEHGDILVFNEGISHYTIAAEGTGNLLQFGNHHKLVEFENSGVFYDPIIKHARKGGYECSSRGDKRFSAMYAVMPDGRTIEQHYQCDVKGYDLGGTNIKLGKGKPPLNTSINTAKAYLTLWNIYLENNPKLVQELMYRAQQHNYILSDMFASTGINQAAALACLLSLRIQEGLLN